MVIGDRNDIVLYRDLKHVGILEYFLKPLIRDLLIARLRRDRVDPNAIVRRRCTGKLIFVLGIRGGVGATTIATNTAWYFAEARRRHTMLLDLDLQNGDAALQLDAAPSTALRDAFESPERVDKLYLERGVKHVTERLDLIASLESLEHASSRLPKTPVLSLLERLLQRYRFVVVDLPPAVAVRMTQMLHLPQHLPAGQQCQPCRGARCRPLARASRSRHPRAQHPAHPQSQRRAWRTYRRRISPGPAEQAPDVIIPYDREIADASIFGVKADAEIRRCSSAA